MRCLPNPLLSTDLGNTRLATGHGWVRYAPPPPDTEWNRDDYGYNNEYKIKPPPPP